MSSGELDFEEVEEHGGLSGYEPSFIDVDGLATRYYDIGSGDPLVLVHGGNWGGMYSANDWTLTFEHLSDQYRVIAFDRVACGLTDNPEDLEEMSYLSELDHALAFLEEIDVNDVNIAGYSRGAGLATRMVVETPDLFNSLVITNSATLGPRTGDREFRRDRIFNRWSPEKDKDVSLEAIRYHNIQYSHQLSHITDEYCLTGAYFESQPKARRVAEVMDEEGGREVWEKSMRSEMDTAHQRIRKGELTIPTLYVFGRNDLTVPLEMAMSAFDMIAQKNDKVRMKIINQCGHMIFREHASEFSRTVVDFIDFWNDN